MIQQCDRCWMCCITAWNIPSNTNRFILDWLKVECIPHLRFCPFLSVNFTGLPSCLIYESRPKICRDFICDRPKMIAYLKQLIKT